MARDDARQNESWFLVTRRGSRVEDLRASRTRPMRRDPTSSTSVFPGKGRARSELKRVFSTDKTQTLVRLEAFFPSAARREPYCAAGARRDPRPALQRSLYIDRDLSRAAEESCSREPERSTPRLARENEMSFVDLPAHVALTILRRLDARDLCALRATCRAFDAALVETAAFEATRARRRGSPRRAPARAPSARPRARSERTNRGWTCFASPSSPPWRGSPASSRTRTSPRWSTARGACTSGARSWTRRGTSGTT